MKRAVFRADASPLIGAGHVMRCMALAASLAELGWECLFATTAESVKTLPILASGPYELVILPTSPEDQQTFLAQHFSDTADILIVDKYDWDHKDEAPCRAWAENILVIDELADRRHDCDMLLDQTYGRDAADYKDLVPDHCQLLCGADFALLRRDFAHHRAGMHAKRQQRGSLGHIMVSMGMTDHPNATGQVLEALQTCDLDVQIDVILGSAAPHLEDVRKRITAMPKASLHQDVKDMAGMIARSDLAIGAAGSSSWERCCLGLASILIICADNQIQVARNLAAQNAALVLGDKAPAVVTDIAETTLTLAKSAEKRAALSQAAFAICDGLGACRVSESIDLICRPDRAPRHFRPAGMQDADIILNWQRHESTRQYFRNPKPPSKEDHLNWMAKQMDRQDGLIELVLIEDMPAGFVRLHPLAADQAAGREVSSQAYEVSIVVSPDHRGQGLGSILLNAAARWFDQSDLIAEVLPGNEASKKLFERAGYQSTDGQNYLNAASTRNRPG